MEEENFYERIERIRGNIEGYELKVKPRVEFLSALLDVFEEKIFNNVALALHVANNEFSVLIGRKTISGLCDRLQIRVPIADVSEGYGAIDILYTMFSKGEALKILDRETFCEYLVLNKKEKELIKWLSENLEGIEGFRAIVIEGLKTYIETIVFV